MTKIKLKTHINPSILTRTTTHKIIYTFLQLIKNADTFLLAIMKTWALCCMLQWKLGHFVACYNENLGSFFHLLKQFFVHFFACNKEIYGTFIFATKQIFLWGHPCSNPSLIERPLLSARSFLLTQSPQPHATEWH